MGLAIETTGLIRLARRGDREALGELLERRRAYLKVLTQRQLDGGLAARLDASDIVQQTCLSAFGQIGQFAGQTGDEFTAWLRRIHERNIQSAVREHVLTKKRSLSREAALPDESLAPLLAAQQSSPSQRLMRGEQAVRLAAALQSLPPDQREAVRLRCLEGWSLAEIAERMQRTRHSVAGLIKRGLLALRESLRAADETI